MCNGILCVQSSQFFEIGDLDIGTYLLEAELRTFQRQPVAKQDGGYVQVQRPSHRARASLKLG